MLTSRFAVHLNRSLVELVGLVIEKTEVAYLKSFPFIFVKKTFQVTCGVASFQIQKLKLILFCRLPASSRREQISMILQFAPHKDLGRSLVRIVDVECLERFSAIAMVKLSRFQKPIGELASVYRR